MKGDRNLRFSIDRGGTFTDVFVEACLLFACYQSLLSDYVTSLLKLYQRCSFQFHTMPL